MRPSSDAYNVMQIVQQEPFTDIALVVFRMQAGRQWPIENAEMQVLSEIRMPRQFTRHLRLNLSTKQYQRYIISRHPDWRTVCRYTIMLFIAWCHRMLSMGRFSVSKPNSWTTLVVLSTILSYRKAYSVRACSAVDQHEVQGPWGPRTMTLHWKVRPAWAFNRHHLCAWFNQSQSIPSDLVFHALSGCYLSSFNFSPSVGRMDTVAGLSDVMGAVRASKPRDKTSCNIAQRRQRSIWVGSWMDSGCGSVGGVNPAGKWVSAQWAGSTGMQRPIQQFALMLGNVFWLDTSSCIANGFVRGRGSHRKGGLTPTNWALSTS